MIIHLMGHATMNVAEYVQMWEHVYSAKFYLSISILSRILIID